MSSSLVEAVLLEDIYSVLKGQELYGLKGDKVKIVSDHDNMLIVEGTRRIVEKERAKAIMRVAGSHLYPVLKEKVQIKTSK